MFSEIQIQYNQTRFQHNFSDADYLFHVASEDVLDFLPTLPHPPKNILILGHFPLLDMLQKAYDTCHVVHNPTFSEVPETTTDMAYDVIISLGQLHWTNDPVRYLQTLNSALTPHGKLWVTFVGEDSFSALRHALIHADIAVYGGAYARIIPMITASDGLQIIREAGAKEPIVSRNRLELKHDSLHDLMTDLRYMGGGNALKERAKHPTSRRVFQMAEAALTRKQSVISTHVDLITISG